jgi:hypothetical protein
MSVSTPIVHLKESHHQAVQEVVVLVEEELSMIEVYWEDSGAFLVRREELDAIEAS